MKKLISMLVLGSLLCIGLGNIAKAHSVTVSYFFEGVDSSRGVVRVAPTRMIILYGKPGNVNKAFQFWGEENAADFKPESDFYFDFDPVEGASLVLLPEYRLPSDPKHIVGMAVLDDVGFNEICEDLLANLVFSDEVTKASIADDPTIVLLTADGDTIVLGNFTESEFGVGFDSAGIVPEPSTMLLFGLGLFSLIGIRMQRKGRKHIKTLLVLIGFVGFLIPHHATAQKYSLQDIQAIPTNGMVNWGAVDWESFTIGNEHYLAIANNSDGSTWNTTSKIFKWDGSQFVEFQSIPTQGAICWEFFAIENDYYLAVANNYDGSTNDLISKIYKWNGSSFVEFQNIATQGITSWEFFTIGNGYYLASDNDDSTIYRWDGAQFKTFQTISTFDIRDWEYFTIDGNHYLVAAAYHDKLGNYSLESQIYKWNGSDFQEFQTITTDGALDWESFSIGGDHFLAVANSVKNSNFNTDSKIYKWNGTSFEEFQSILTSQAYSWEFVTTGTNYYLAVANHGTEATGWTTDSKVYKWNGTNFEEFQSITTSYGCDWEALTINNEQYLVVADFTNSRLYKYVDIIPNFCNNVTEIPKSECEVLTSLYNSIDGDNGNIKKDWFGSNTPCHWGGIVCDVGHIATLGIQSSQLNAPLSSIIGNLSNLKELKFYSTPINASISAIGNINSLQVLNIYSSPLNSGLPSEIGKLLNLQELKIYSSPFNGGIPPELGSLGSLKKLKIYSSPFNGGIPPELGNLINVEELELYSNNMTGGIPPELGKLANLSSLGLSGNQLSGGVPAELGDLANLKQLLLQNNQLTGSLPKELTQLLQVQSFRFKDTNLCEPQDADFQNWLANIPIVESSNIVCNAFCDSVTEISRVECEALESLYNTTNGDNWIDNTDWMETDTPCSWFGVTCEAGAVTQLHLNNNQLNGTIPSEIGLLTELQSFGLQFNKLFGPIPTEIGHLTKLRKLYLHVNQLAGTIPPELGHLSNLQALYLTGNQLDGSLPAELGSLVNLQSLLLGANQLDGSIPSELGNLANLTFLELHQNRLSGTIPASLGNLTNLQELDLFENQLTGTIPQELGSLIHLQEVQLHDNQLTGSIPSELGNLTNLRILNLQDNQLSGNLPSELSQLVNLQYLTVSHNNLEGTIPLGMGNLTNLLWLGLARNNFMGTIPSELKNLTRLEQLYLYENNLSGEVPSGLGQLANLQKLHLNQNQLSGTLPSDLKELANLTELFFQATEICEPQDSAFQMWLSNLPNVQNSGNQCLSPGVCSNVTEIPQAECEALLSLYNSTSGPNWTDNSGWGQTNTPCDWFGVTCVAGHVTQVSLENNNLQGTIPADFGNLSGLIRVVLGTNRLNGEIPSELGNLLDLQMLYLYDNQLSGNIPAELGNLSDLQALHLRDNQLTGTIPGELGQLSSLNFLCLSHNELTGSIPAELGNLTQLDTLRLYHNQLNGNIPPQIGNLISLKSLLLHNNQLSGSIPDEIGDLTALELLELGSNQLSGSIPQSVGNLLNLTTLKCYDNQLSGSIPQVLGNLSHLTLLHLRDNQLSGNIPAEIGNLVNLTHLLLDINQFDGVIPSELGALSRLEELYLFSNNLEGSLPISLKNLTGLQVFRFNNTNLCEPQSADFQNWLASVPTVERTNVPCNSCNSVTEIPKTECEALEALYIDTNGDGWLDNGGWFEDDTPCLWSGVTCEGGHVTRLELRENQLNGSISPQLGQLVNLEYLDLFNNQLSGSIPSELGNLANVQYLDFSRNRLNGPIPPQLGNLTNVQYVALFDNQLSGSIPAELGNLINLQQLGLFNNQLSGAIPSALGDLANLRYLYLWENRLSGNIPPELSGLTNLERLMLYNNRLNGIIPSELGSLANLQILGVHNNQFTGNLPAELGALTELQELYVNDNQFSNSLPKTFTNLAALQKFYFDRTNLCEPQDSDFQSWLLNIPELKRNGNTCFLSDGLVAYYPVDGNTNDESGNGNHGIPAGDIGFVDGVLNEAVHFNGTQLGRRINIPYTVANGLRDFTYALFLKVDTFRAGINLLSGARSSSNHNAFTIGYQTGADRWSISFNQNLSALAVNSLIEDRAWHHVAVTRQGGAARLFLDGVQIGNHISVTENPVNIAPNGLMIANDQDCVGGCFELRHIWSGEMDDIRIYNRALNEGEILKLYAGTNSATFCENVTEISKSECGALVSLYDSTNGEGWTNRTGWMETITPCSWYGVSCNNNSVTGLNLANNQLTGEIPYQLGNLVKLTELGLQENFLNGDIPPTLGGLESLEVLHLHSNRLSGSLPAALGNLTRLRELILRSNQLSGNIPAEIGKLTKLNHLALESNQLSGEIPAAFGNLLEIRQLELARNQLSGKIPPELGKLAELEKLQLLMNQLDGSVPAELGNLENLQELSLSNNNLSGPLPLRLTDIPNVQLFNFSDTSLCEPQSAVFQGWSGNIPAFESSGIACSFCDSVTEIPSSECGALVSLYNSTDGNNWIRQTNWLATDTPCSWFGVTCENGQVSHLDLFGNRLQGKIPADISNLSSLREIYLYGNKLSGTIPPEIGSMAALEILDLHNNDLSGGIPPELGNLGQLRFFDLSRNKLSGTIPVDLSKLTTLTYLDLYKNQLSGVVPPELNKLVGLKNFYLSFNPLEGVLPAGFSNLANVREFFFNNTNICEPSDAPLQSWLAGMDEMEGTGQKCDFSCASVTEIPVAECEALVSVFDNTNGADWFEKNGWRGSESPCEWDGVTCENGQVAYLDLARNNLSGSLPADLNKLTALKELYLFENNLSGGIPLVLGGMAALEVLDLYGNALSGEIPPELGNLASLKYLDLSGNQFSGSVPKAFANLTNLEKLFLHYNPLRGALPDTLTALTALKELAFEGTDICEPADAAFTTWVEGLEQVWRTGFVCSFCDTAASLDVDVHECKALESLYIHTNGARWTEKSGWLNSENICDWYGVSCENGHVSTLNLSGNQLEGPIPPAIAALGQLRRLDLRENDLDGPISIELTTLRSLRTLDLGNNRFSGPIPTEFKNLIYLLRLNLGGNLLTGPIPADLQRMKQLTHLWLMDNDLSGTLPAELGTLGNLTDLRVSNNPNLTGSLAANLMNVPTLQSFSFESTGLCELPDAAFQSWLSNVTHDGARTGLLCPSSSFTIATNAGANGSISPAETVIIPLGGEQTFNFTPDFGFLVANVSVDGVSVGRPESYTFGNVQSDYVLNVTFVNSYDFLNFEAFGGRASDINKNDITDKDDDFCWMLAAANILEWTGWGGPWLDSAQSIYDYFYQNWSEGGGLMNYAWDWFFSGYASGLPDEEGWAQYHPDSGAYWTNLNVFDFYADSPYGYNALDYITQYLKSGYGVGLTLYDGLDYSHALTAWGYQYDAEGNIIGLYVTDSDDRKFEEGALHLLEVASDDSNTLWTVTGSDYNTSGLYVDDWYVDWMLTGAVALKPKPANGPSAIWGFDEPDGSIARDATGNGHDGQIVGAIRVPGIDGGALHFFQGDRDRVHAPGNFSEYVSEHFTVMLWAKVTHVKNINMLFHSSDAQPGILLDGENRAGFLFKGNTDAAPLPGEQRGFLSEPLPIGEWVHVACTWDGVRFSGYVDGKLVGQKALPSFHLGGRIFIGQSDGGPERSFDGAIDDVRIYDRALSIEDIQEQLHKTDMLARWKFDELAGDVVIDSSGNKHHGRIFHHRDPLVTGSDEVTEFKAETPWIRTKGILGGGLNLTEGHNYVAVPDDGSLSMKGEMTVEAWLKAGDISFVPLVYKNSHVETSNDNYLLVARADGFYFGIENSINNERPGVASITQPEAGKWYHLAGVYDNEALHIYVNGVLEKSLIIGSVVPPTGTADLILGTTYFSSHDGDNRGWADTILDDVRLYKRALSADEIAAHAKEYFTVTAIAAPGGEITPEGETLVEKGANQSFSLTPDSGNTLLELWVDGLNVLTEPFHETYTYHFDNVVRDHAIEPVFLERSQTFTIFATSEGGGWVSPSGKINLEQGASQTFVFEPEPGSRIANVIIDGEPQGPSKTYTFESLDAPHDIHVIFIGLNEQLALLKKMCVEKDDDGNEAEVECSDEIDATIMINGEHVDCGSDCSLYVGVFSETQALIFDALPNDTSVIVRWETAYGELLENGIYYSTEDVLIDPVIGRNIYDGNSHGGNSHGGNSHGGNSHGGNSHGGNSHGGNSHGGNSHGGNSHGGNSHGGNSHGGNSHGGNSHGGNSHGGNSHGGNSHGGNSHG